MLLVLSFIVGNAFVETYAMCIVDWSEDWAILGWSDYTASEVAH